MDNADGRQGVAMVASGRAVIDTRSPFQSVKEAVALFGEKVLAGELYAKHLQEMQSEGGEHIHVHANYRTLAAELEETKQSLEKALEENDSMANRLESLKQELELTKIELEKFQDAQEQKKEITTEVEIEEVKFVENAREVRVVEPRNDQLGSNAERVNKYVKFADHPHSLARAMATGDREKMKQQKKKRPQQQQKMVHPLVGWFIRKKSGSQTSCRSLKDQVILSAYL